MADNPKTGRSDKPGFPGSISDIFLGLAKGAISVFNPPDDVTRIDVWKADGTWNNAGRLTRARDRIEAKPVTGNEKQVRRGTIAKAGLIDRINTRLDQLTEGAPIGPGDEPIPDFGASDQQTSPVFRSPGAIGIGGGILLGVGGMSDAEKELRDAARAASKKYAEAVKRGRKVSPVAKRLPPLPKTSLEKAVSAGLKVLEKVPKSMLPDAELVGLAKTIGKALRGGFGPLAAQVVGTVAIEKSAAVLARKQFEQMTKILGPQDAAAVAARQMASKGPSTRRPGRAQLSQEPPRPRPPGNTGSPNQHPGRSTGKAPIKTAIKTPLEEIKQVKVTARKYATPAQMAQGRAPRAPPGGITRSQVILGAAKALGQFGNAALFGQKTRARGNTSLVNNFAPSTQPGRQLFAQPSPQAVTTAAQNCYTVCRKKSTGKKKRAKPRVCISPAKASRLGLT